MVVLCERCRTRFQLDDQRVPAAGVRVRCSRCKHGFLLRPPVGAQPGVAGAGAPDGALSRPADEPLRPFERAGEFDAAAQEDPDPADPGSASSNEWDPEGDSEWEFNTDLPEPERGGGERAHREAPGATQEPAGNLQELPSFEDIGDPESWDFLAEDQLGPDATSPSPTAVPDQAVASPIDVALGEPTRPAGEDRSFSQSAPPALGSRRSRLPIGELLGWVATAALLAIAAHGGLRVSARSGLELPGSALVAGFRIERLRARTIENAPGGMLYVVSGQVRNPSARTRPLGSLLNLTLRHPGGARIPGLQAPAGRALTTTQLREEDPARLEQDGIARAEALARLPIAPGETLEFDALFRAPFPEAARLIVETEPIPHRLRGRLEGPHADDPATPTATPFTGSGTSSLPASALPSSE